VIAALVARHYALDVAGCERASGGVGGHAYRITAQDGRRYILKQVDANAMNHPEREPALNAYLAAHGIPVASFVATRRGGYVWRHEGRVCHLQTCVEGAIPAPNAAPEGLMAASAELLGRIHHVLRDYPPLPEGIGSAFWAAMTPERACASYERSLGIARQTDDAEAEEALGERLRIAAGLGDLPFDPQRLSRGNTHGDYVIGQLVCGRGEIRAVIDWTSACVHPLCFEVLRSFVHAEPTCATGAIDAERLLRYVGAYRRYYPLTSDDLAAMPWLYYWQLAVCDYYGQAYGADPAYRPLFMRQAAFATRLLRWLHIHGAALSERLARA
jgi:Ser/Thr protein kinase RdoA (MazF antagonist)